MKKTVLNPVHRDMQARMVAFGEWDMPVNYGSQIEEHHVVRQDAGMFDVSHMRCIDIRGGQTRDLLRFLLSNDVARLKDRGKALYSCMLNENGGVIDDLIVYYMNDEWFRMVVNAGTAEKDIAWISALAANYHVSLDVRQDLAMIAIQGPNARQKALPVISRRAHNKLAEKAAQIKPFFAAASSDDWFIGRTGYTGEDGFEVLLPADEASGFWTALMSAGVRPCGLGARDTLRLEAGMNLYGSDMDETVTPLESGLTWTVAFEPEERDFIGKSSLLALKAAGDLRRFTGLLLEGRGVFRDHQQLFEGDRCVGEITSGGFSPTLNRAIAFARLNAEAGEQLTVDMRGKKLPVICVKLPFARSGKACY